MRYQIRSIFQGKEVEIRQTNRAVSPYGGLVVFFEYLNQIKYREAIERWMPFVLKSPNAIQPSETFTSFIVAVLTGARRFAQTGLIRLDAALQKVMGIERFPGDDTIRNFFKRFSQGENQRFYEPLWRWQLERIVPRAEGYSLDLDSTVFERYGKQQGARKGHNPRKHGRPSHHPLLAVLAEVHWVLHGWLRSGNCASGRGAVEFLKEALALLGGQLSVRLVRADSGFFDDELLSFLEGEQLPYIVVARMTRWLKRQAAQVREWRPLEAQYAVGQFELELHGWKGKRHFVVVREQEREDKSSLGRKLLEVPGYTFRVFVTNLEWPEEQVWRTYNLRADMENRIAELKYDLAADDFCLNEFFATEATFKAILFLFNLLSEFQRVLGLKKYQQPSTLRTHLFLCGAILGRAGHRSVIFLSKSWGGLEQRIPWLDKVLYYVFPTSPKLEMTPVS